MKRLTLCLALTSLAGCSLVNSFDDVKSEISDSGTSSGGKSGTGGKGGDDAGAGGAKGGDGGSDGGSDAGSKGGAGGQDSDAATGGSGGGEEGGTFDPDQDVGVLVAYRAKGTSLAVVNVETGVQVSTEPIGAVRGIVNEGQRNYWYIFVQGATPADGSTVSVRQLDPTTGVWKELGTKAGLPNPASSIGVLNQRLAYVSDNAGTQALTVLDTTDPKAVKVVTPNTPLAAGLKQGLVATPGSAVNAGGSVNLFVTSDNCTTIGDAGAGLRSCEVVGYTFIVNSSGVAPAQVPSRIVGGVVSGATLGSTQDLAIPRSTVVVLPVIADANDLTRTCAADDATRAYKGSVQKLNPIDLSPQGDPVEFGFESDRVRGIAFDTCSNIAFAGTVANDPGIHLVPMDTGGTPFHACVEGGGVFAFEPFTRTLLRTTLDGDVQAFKVGGTRTAPTLAPAVRGVPANFVATIMAVRASPACK